VSNVRPGSFGLSVIQGKVGFWVDKGQEIVERQKYKYTHAFLVLDNDTVIEAEPGGAKLSPLAPYLKRRDTIFSDEPVQQYMDKFYARNKGQVYGSQLADEENRIREKIVDFGRSLKGTPYNYLDYLAIGLDRFGIHPALIRRRLSRTDRLICSQLVDYVYQHAGIHLFDDGRDPANVTPGDLEGWIRDHG
jgi:hypothetical protein